MARFKKHTVVYGDTPQIIAEQEMGDANLWIDLIKANDLNYPYIVKSTAEKEKNPRHLVMLGDSLIIPKEETLADINTNALSKLDRFKLEDIVLGTDLNVTKFSETYNSHGAEDGIVELTANDNHDLSTVSGVENVKQMIILSLLTPKGSLVLHPDYGSDLQSLIGMSNTPDNAVKINKALSACLLADSRISDANCEKYSIAHNMYTATWEVGLQDFDSYFMLLIQRDNKNDFKII